MGIADSTRRSSTAAIVAGLNAGAANRRTDMQQQKDKQANFMEQYGAQKKQIAETISSMRTQLDSTYLSKKSTIAGLKLAEGEEGQKIQMFQALDSFYQKGLEEFKTMKDGQFKAFSGSVTAPMIELGYLPKNQIDVDRQAFSIVGTGLRLDEQAVIDAIPAGAEAQSKARGSAVGRGDVINLIGPKGERVGRPSTDPRVKALLGRGFQKQSPVSIGVQGDSLESAGLTRSQGGKERVAKMDAQESFLNLQDEIENLNEILDKGASGGFVGDTFKATDAISSGVKTLAGFMGTSIDEKLGESIDVGSFFPKLKEQGVMSQEVENAALSVAVMIAASEGQTGRGLSDKDMDRYLKRIGDSSSIEQFRASLKAEMKRAERRFERKMQVRFGVRPPDRSKSENKASLPSLDDMSPDELDAEIKRLTKELGK